jgi:hypothetical protein
MASLMVPLMALILFAFCIITITFHDHETAGSVCHTSESM